MHRNFHLTQENFLSRHAILRSLRWLARASALDRKPRAHLAVGSGQEIAEVRRRVRREAGISGRCGRRVTARIASRRAPCACPDHWATPLPAQAATRRRIGRRFLRDAARGWWTEVCAGLRAQPDPSPGRHRGRRRPARTLQAVGASPSARRVREPATAPREASAALARAPWRLSVSSATRKRRRWRAPAVALATAKARTAPSKRRRPMEAPALAAAPASPRCRPWRAGSPARSAGPGGRGRGAAGSAARWSR